MTSYLRIIIHEGRVGPTAAAGEGVKLGVPSPAGPFGTAGAMEMQADKEGGGGSDKSEPKPAADEPAKLDEPSFANNAKPAERVTAERLAARPEFKGRTFPRTTSSGSRI